MKMRWMLLLAVSVLCASWATAQPMRGDTTLPERLSVSACDNNITLAREYFQIGDFGRGTALLRGCVTRRNFSEADLLEEATVLLIDMYLRLDVYDSARLFVQQLIDVNPLFQTRSDDELMFRLMVEDVKRLERGVQVTSVSKVSESLYEAPATVILITEEQIKQRGYMDITQLLRDLPGFDLSRSNGILYSHIYQRGYRSNNTNRMLLLIDGVEENDLWGNIVYLSRQYPISNIKSVEVVYGPASTIYGANAFLGVISIITKNAREQLNYNQNLGLDGEWGMGAYNTRYIDATVSLDVPKYNMDGSVTARYFRSDEPDFSDVDRWQDFKPWTIEDPFNPRTYAATVGDLYRNAMAVTDTAAIQSFVSRFGGGANSDWFELRNDSLVPTRQGIEQALFRDNQLMAQESFHDYTESFLLSGKLRFNNLVLGFQNWYRIEGLGSWYTDAQRGGEQYWSPRSLFAYVKYEKPFTERFSMSTFVRYKLHGYRPETYLTLLNGYRNGRLGLEDLMNEAAPSWDTTYFATVSNQLRFENRFFYNFGQALSLVGGIEARFSAIQDDYATSSTRYPLESDPDFKHYFYRDIGVFAQATVHFEKFKSQARWLRPLRHLSLNAGYRWDNNVIWDREGFGSNVSPRLVAVYHRKRWIAKAIYASAFKTPTNFDLYSTVEGTRELPSPGLKPEIVENYEGSIRFFFDRSQQSSIEAVGFYAKYRNAIETQAVPYNGGTTQKFVSIGEREVLGLQVTADYHHRTRIGQLNYWINYTFNEPIDSRAPLSLDSAATRPSNGGILGEYTFIADIAISQIHFGVNYTYNQRLNLNLRGNWVGDRPTGLYTSVETNPYGDLFHGFGDKTDIWAFESHLLMHLTASYRFPTVGLTIQGVVNNLFNKEYFDPGIRTADLFQFSGRLPQNGREIHLKLKFDLGVSLTSQQRDEYIR